MIEVNGPANIVMMIDELLDERGKLSPAMLEQLLDIKSEAETTIKYLRQLSNPRQINWHDVK